MFQVDEKSIQWDDKKVFLVEMRVCGQCLNGRGGQCNEPACVFFLHKTDILPVWKELCTVKGAEDVWDGK